VQVVQVTPCGSIELPNEVGHFEPLATTPVETRIQFPSPAPLIFGYLPFSAVKAFCSRTDFDANITLGIAGEFFFPRRLLMFGLPAVVLVRPAQLAAEFS
jgi:hypothetical protein